ncbi:poly(A)-binding protein binding protein [Didymella pomorum]
MSSSPSGRGPGASWGDHQAVIGRADVKDDRATQGERRAAGRRLKYKWSAVKLASTGEDNELKQAHASGQTAVDRSRALSPASQEALLQQREQRSIVGTQNASQPERSPSLGRVPDDLVIVAKDAVIPPRKATKPHDATTSVEHNLPNSFKEFSAAEKLRVAEHYQSIACGNKAVKLNELKRFALNFKLSTSIPADLVPVLAKDEIKQGAIVQKALKQATAGEHSGFVHELDKKLQEDCKRAFDQPLQERLRAARHAAEQSREAKDVHARPIANEESATPRGKQASTGNPIDILHISDLSHQFSPITSMAYDDLDPRYLEDGLTWNSDTLGIRDPGFDDGSELASALGSDNCKYVERPMRKDFDDDSEASLSRSSTPDGYTPTSGSDNECAPSKSVTDTEFPVRSESSEMSFKQALQVFNLGDYLSVDMSLLHERLEHRLFSGDCDHVVIASAFTTIVKHQHETKSWTVRLDWDDDGDHFLLDDHIGTHHDKWANTAHEFDTTQDDCWQRWANLKPKDWEPKSACKCSIAGDVSCCCCSGETWTPNLDDKLVSLKADNCSWADIASRFWYFNEEDCKTRFKRIKPKGWKPNSKKQNTKQKTTATRNQREQQEIATAEITAKVESIADEDAAPDFWCGRSWGRLEWTADEDTRLINLRWQNCI